MVHLGSANGQRILRWASNRRPSPSAGFVQVGLRNSKALQYSGRACLSDFSNLSIVSSMIAGATGLRQRFCAMAQRPNAVRPL